MKNIFLIVCLLIATSAVAQEKDQVEWASPSVEGMNAGKGLIFSYRRSSPYDIESESQVPDMIADSRGDVERIQNLTFKLRLPVLLKDKTQLVVGFQYLVDEFEFNNPEELQSEFYKELHHQPLRSRGLRFYLNHSVSDRKFIFTRIGVELNGHIPDDWYNTLKYSLSGVYGWKQDPTKSWGVGFYFSYNFGRPTILPAILYNKTWNDRWGIEALFPGMVQLRYNSPSKRSYVYLGWDVEGASYNLDRGNTLNSSFEDVQLRRSEVTPLIRYEREVYDFVWLSIQGGYRYNINFNISEDYIFDEKEIIKNDVQSGVFIEGSLFIIPTESLKKLIKKDETT